MPDLVVIANPVSGGGRGRKAGEAVVRTLRERGVSVKLRLTEGRGDGARLTSEALSAGCRRFAVCGGDGVIHEVAGALANSGAALGIVPCGRGNDLARALGIPKNLKEAIEVLVSGEERRIDLGKVGGRYFCTVACMGFDAEAGRAVYEHQAPFSGTAAYVLAVLKTLRTYRGAPVRIAGDFGVFEGPILLAAIGNTGFYGGGMQILPQAACDDGLLDVCIIDPLPRLKLLRYFPRIFSGSHISLPEVHTLRGRSIRIESPRPLWIFADGEPICQTPAQVEVVEKALTVIRP
ncbi:MAG: diacylglycerol kinase family lipid kinase [Candidatus Latescibacteria bacterium]|nr:diacylglycerol kinase family lipid kinase [Candidatus Latescibacterota bacterium]